MTGGDSGAQHVLQEAFAGGDLASVASWLQSQAAERAKQRAAAVEALRHYHQVLGEGCGRKVALLSAQHHIRGYRDGDETNVDHEMSRSMRRFMR